MWNCCLQMYSKLLFADVYQGLGHLPKLLQQDMWFLTRLPETIRHLAKDSLHLFRLTLFCVVHVLIHLRNGNPQSGPYDSEKLGLFKPFALNTFLALLSCLAYCSLVAKLLTCTCIVVASGWCSQGLLIF